MNKILNKRDSLERFIKEQTLGPGINGYRYVDLEDDAVLKNLNIERAIDYSTEILNSMPASIYSTGILFPMDESKTAETGISLENNEIIENSDEIEEDSQDNSLDDIETSDTVNLNQIFPMSMGITFCVNNNFLTEGFIKFRVNARIYKKIKRDKEGLFNKKIGLLCEVDRQAIQVFLQKNKLSRFKVVTIGENNFITLEKISSEQIAEIRKIIWAISKDSVLEIFEKKVKPLIKTTLNFTPQSISSLIQTIYNELKNTVTDENTRILLYKESQNIELIENIINHLVDLLDINSGRELWQSKKIECNIIIEDILFPNNKSKQSYLHNKPFPNKEKVRVIYPDGVEQEGLKDIFKYIIDEKENEYASLSANIQISRDSRMKSDKIFVKFQLINDSTSFKKDPEGKRYYSVATEKVNNKSFFGVKISAENKNIIPYSNYKYLSENNGVFNEDTTTRFIYDQYEDYAIGHGCSVRWNNKGENTIVETEYLPICETPDIDPTPRDKSKEAIFDIESNYFNAPLFLENSKSQEFKWLSVFSDAKNDEIIKGLEDFVDSYGHWIKLKREEDKYKIKHQDIAKQELDKCYIDYLRMKRNIINFLSGNSNEDNLNSFRLMNGAMFMQLWHSVKVKQNKVISIIELDSFSNFNFDFYKINADDKLFPPIMNLHHGEHFSLPLFF